METCLKKLTKKSPNGKPILAAHGDGRYRLNDFKKPRQGNQLLQHDFVGKLSVQLEGCQIDGRTPVYRYFDCPNTTIESDIEGYANKIDGAMIPIFLIQDDLKNSAGHCRTINIAVACEWKSKTGKTDKLEVSVTIFAHIVMIEI